MTIASCAGSEDDVNVRADDTDGGTASDATADTNDATCELDFDACAEAQDLTCDDVDWCPVETNLPKGLGLSSVWGSGVNDVWAAGAGGSVIHWDGNEWTSASIDSKRSLYAIWGTGPNDIWTVSSADKIFHTTGFAGETTQWSPMASIGDADKRGVMHAIWGTSPSDVWVGGDSFQVQRPDSNSFEAGWRSIVVDGGTTWAPTLQGIDGAVSPHIMGIWGSGPEDIWLVGWKKSAQWPWPPVSFAAHTTGVAAADGGAPVWTELDTQSIAILRAVWGTGAGDVWTVGDYGTIRRMTAGAEMWSSVECPTTENLRGLWGAGPDDIWAVGEHGTLLHYDGAAWRTSTAVFPPGDKPHLNSVWGSGPSDVWAVGSRGVMHFSGPKPGAHGATP